MTTFTIEIALAVIGVLLLALDAFLPSLHRRTVPLIAVASTAAALALLFFAKPEVAGWLQPYFQVDKLALFYKALALVATLVVLIIALEADSVVAYFSSAEGTKTRISEYFALPLIICAGMMWMASAKDLVSVFVPLELVTVSFYVLVAFTRRSALSLEAGVKYLILGALSTGILVYGIAWVYGATGHLDFAGIATAAKAKDANTSALLFGAALLLAGMGFKVGAAPFQVWIPDVYQGASTPVTAFLSVGSKAAGFVVLTRAVQAFTAEGSVISSHIAHALLLSAGLTILLGSLPAIYQTNLKRLLAYSSISHAGFLVLALACGESSRFGLAPGGVVAFYLATYLPMTLLAFLLLAVLRGQGVGDNLSDLTNLAKRSPFAAFALTVAFASLAGLPLTAGFFGKLLVFIAAVDQAHYFTVSLAVIGAAAGFYYYFRPILAVYTRNDDPVEPLALSPLTQATAILLTAAIIVLGVYPKLIQGVLAKL